MKPIVLGTDLLEHLGINLDVYGDDLIDLDAHMSVLYELMTTGNLFGEKYNSSSNGYLWAIDWGTAIRDPLHLLPIWARLIEIRHRSYALWVLCDQQCPITGVVQEQAPFLLEWISFENKPQPITEDTFARVFYTYRLLMSLSAFDPFFATPFANVCETVRKVLFALAESLEKQKRKCPLSPEEMKYL